MRRGFLATKLAATKGGTVKAKISHTREKLQVRWVMFLAVGGTTLAAFVAGAGVISGAPGKP